jgi:hypothetical protein
MATHGMTSNSDPHVVSLATGCTNVATGFGVVNRSVVNGSVVNGSLVSGVLVNGVVVVGGSVLAVVVVGVVVVVVVGGVVVDGSVVPQLGASAGDELPAGVVLVVVGVVVRVLLSTRSTGRQSPALATTAIADESEASATAEPFCPPITVRDIAVAHARTIATPRPQALSAMVLNRSHHREVGSQ